MPPARRIGVVGFMSPSCRIVARWGGRFRRRQRRNFCEAPAKGADKMDMTHAISLKESVLETQALLHYAAYRLATRSGGRATLYDTVSLSDSSAAVVDGKISAATNVRESAAVDVQREKPQDG